MISIIFQIYVFQKEVVKSRNKDVVELFEFAVGIHHAGMLRADRVLTEQLFSDGLLKVTLIQLNGLSFGCTFSLNYVISVPGACLHSNFGMGCESACSHRCD